MHESYVSLEMTNLLKQVGFVVRANHIQTDKHWRETYTKNEF